MFTYDYFEDEDEEEVTTKKNEKDEYQEAKEWLENQKV